MLVAQNDFESYVLKLQISTSVKQPKVQQHRQHNTTQTLQKPNENSDFPMYSISHLLFKQYSTHSVESSDGVFLFLLQRGWIDLERASEKNSSDQIQNILLGRAYMDFIPICVGAMLGKSFSFGE